MQVRRARSARVAVRVGGGLTGASWCLEVVAEGAAGAAAHCVRVGHALPPSLPRPRSEIRAAREGECAHSSSLLARVGLFSDFFKRRCSASVARRSVKVRWGATLVWCPRQPHSARPTPPPPVNPMRFAQVCFPEKYAKCVDRVFDACFASSSPFRKKAPAGAPITVAAVARRAGPASSALSPCAAVAAMERDRVARRASRQHGAPTAAPAHDSVSSGSPHAAVTAASPARPYECTLAGWMAGASLLDPTSAV